MPKPKTESAKQEESTKTPKKTRSKPKEIRYEGSRYQAIILLLITVLLGLAFTLWGR